MKMLLIRLHPSVFSGYPRMYVANSIYARCRRRRRVHGIHEQKGNEVFS